MYPSLAASKAVYWLYSKNGAVAQLGERNTGSVEVVGSIPSGSTNQNPKVSLGVLLFRHKSYFLVFLPSPRMSLIALAAPVCRVCGFCLIFVPFGHYDEPEILSYAIPLFCSIGADVRQVIIMYKLACFKI
jgi:hypothetical protein